MLVQVKVSLGELVDKLTILAIKSEKITDPEKLKHVKREFDELKRTLDELNLEGIDEHFEELKKINEELWVIEDDIRDKERDKEFDEAFVKLARAVYVTNDQRFGAKARCNERYGSELQEVKSYQKYD